MSGRLEHLLLPLLLLVGGTPASGSASGQIRFSAAVDRTEVALDETVTLTLTVTGDAQISASNIVPPGTGTLEIVGTSTSESTSFSFSGGTQQFTRMVNFHYVLKPTRTGKTRIGAAVLKLGGKSWRSRPIDILVVKSSGRRRGAPQSPLQRRFPSWLDDDWNDLFHSPDMFPRRRIGPDDIFVRLTLKPDLAVEGQQLTATLRIYSRVGARVVSIRWPGLNDFFVVDRDVSKAVTEQQQINGRLYHTKVIDRRALFPLRSGELEMGAVEVDVDTSTSPFYPAQTMHLRTRPRRLTIMPLPGQDRPRDFHPANVGQFSMAAAVDATRVALNQPITFTLTIRGTGAIQRIRPPAMPRLGKFRIFDSTSKVEVSNRGALVRGSKQVETILVPLTSGQLTLPALTFSYYDPSQGSYRTLSTEPITLQVAASQEGTDGGSPLVSHEVNLVAGSFKPIRFESELSVRGMALVDRPFFWPLVALPPGLYLLVVLGLALRARGQADTTRNRMRQAWLLSRRHLRKAARLAAAGQAADFYAELKAALVRGFEARCSQPLHGLPLNEAARQLEEEGFAEQLVEAWRTEVENCDFGRFSPASSRGEQMQQSLARARKLFKTIERTRPGTEVRP